MTSLVHSSDEALTVSSPFDVFLRQRLQVVEDLWEDVIQQECGQNLVNVLKQLRDLCSPEGQATNEKATEVVSLISQLELNEAIRAARAFALYFQLINLVEQHYEQREQLTRSLRHTKLEQKLAKPAHSDQSSQVEQEAQFLNGTPGAELLEKSWQAINNERQNKGTFHTLFPHLHKMNVPPQQIQRLIDQLDVRLVFTAHPTEIVRPTYQRQTATDG
jgi:phosphoenolpyruvate carboxylase